MRVKFLAQGNNGAFDGARTTITSQTRYPLRPPPRKLALVGI